MICVFVSNILDHHSTHLCEEYRKQFDSFSFVATDNASNYGYQTAGTADFVIPYYDENRKQEAIDQILDADVVIFGSCPDALIKIRMDANKLSFLYSERFFKKGTWRRFIPTTRKSVMNRIGKYKNMYVLCASAYLPYDLSLIGFPTEKCFKWGYFPEAIEYKDVQALKSVEKIHLLWVGRLLGWKHPEMAINLAELLKKDGFDFELDIIGDGNLKNSIEEEINMKQLDVCVNLLGSKTPEEVREYMEKSHIFISTSDFYEGWGAVLNEAMNSGCAVVASHAAGSTPYLVEDNVNGLIFESENIKDLYKKVKRLLDNAEEQKRIARAAYESIRDTWNAKVAVERFRKLTEVLLAGEKNVSLYKSGPCSRAEIIKNSWYKQ